MYFFVTIIEFLAVFQYEFQDNFSIFIPLQNTVNTE